MTFEELNPKLQRADKLRRLSGKFREEWEGIMKKEFWSFLVGHQYWKEFLAYESGQDLGTIEKLITLGCKYNAFGEREIPQNVDVWSEGWAINVVFETGTRNKAGFKDTIWCENIKLEDLGRIDDLGKNYLKNRKDIILKKIEECDEIIAMRQEHLNEEIEKKKSLEEQLKLIEKD